MDYSTEPPVTEAERDTARKRAKARNKTLYALTIVCNDEADQKDLFPRISKLFPGRRCRVVVS